MHISALNFGKLFFETYCVALQDAIVHDIGAQNVNGSLHDVCPPHLGYVGIDFVEGRGVDIVLDDPYRLPFSDGSLDIIVSSSCFEHSQFYWLSFLEMLRVLKPGGLLYINVPSNGSFHRYPVDCWRFYPDAGKALEAWAEREGYQCKLLESFVGEHSPDSFESGGAWNDFVAVFVKDRAFESQFPVRMLDQLQNYWNGLSSSLDGWQRPGFLSPDHERLAKTDVSMAKLQEQTAELRLQVAALNEQIVSVKGELEQSARSLIEARAQCEQKDSELLVAHDRIEELLRSRSWQMTAPVRWLGRIARKVQARTRTVKRTLAKALPMVQASSTRLAAEVDDIRQSGQFDESYYLATNPDLEPSPADLIRHYCEVGWREGRKPSDDFDTNSYLRVYRDIREAGINPFWHYVMHGAAEQRHADPDAAVRYEDGVWFGRIDADVRLLAFYTDAPDWIAARTERRATKGSSQPLLPHEDLGFYEPEDSAVLKHQTRLARRHGLQGFCFSLVPDEQGIFSSRALETCLNHPDIDFQFCARLDLRTTLLMPRQFASLARALADIRYFRVEGRVVILVDIADAPQNIRAFMDKLMAELDVQSGGKPFVIGCWSGAAIGAAPPRDLAMNCDALVDLPNPPVPGETGDYPLQNDDGIDTAPFSVVAAHGAKRALSSRVSPVPVYHCVVSGRDNTSKRAAKPLVYEKFHLRHYRRWLDVALQATRRLHPAERRLLFINGWNDWNEGAVIEPDGQTGYSRLNETSRSLLGVPSGISMPKVSVIVPNYNHGRFLHRRLDSIYGQSYKNIEVILLDDCSSDNSRAVLDEYAAAYPEVTRKLYNEVNSGGVFRQWAKGIKAATGDLVWIAESDDYCDQQFLEVLVRRFEDEAVMLAYAKCTFVNAEETPIAYDFQTYVQDLACAAKWRGAYVETSHNEVRSALGIKNTIPNASGVVFKRPVDMRLLDEAWWLSMAVAGDWVFYLHVIHGGKVAYDPGTTNYFRRYEGSTADTTYRKSVFYKEVGLASQTVAELYDVPLSVLERCRDGYRDFYRAMVGGADLEFALWYDFAAVLIARTKRRPSVMICTTGFFPGGAEIFPIRLANEFKRQGLSVLLLSTGLNLCEDGVRRMLRNDVPLVETSDIETVREVISEFGIEVLNTHQWHIQKYPFQVPDVFRGLKGHVATLHGMIEHGNAFGVTEHELRAADAAVSIWVYTADKNLGPFKELGLYDAASSRFLKMPNGIPTPRIQPVPRGHMGIPESAFVLCCVSRAIPDKGWVETIEAVERARELSARDIHLVLVGNGPVYDDFRRLALPGYVHLVGFSQNSVGYYSAADMGIMLTKFRSESFPLTIIDCLFADRPFIATEVGEIRNMLTVDDRVAGALLGLDDWQVPVEAVARAIALFASDEILYQTACSVVGEVASRFRIEEVASRYAILFDRCAIGVPQNQS